MRNWAKAGGGRGDGGEGEDGRESGGGRKKERVEGREKVDGEEEVEGRRREWKGKRRWRGKRKWRGKEKRRVSVPHLLPWLNQPYLLSYLNDEDETVGPLESRIREFGSRHVNHERALTGLTVSCGLVSCGLLSCERWKGVIAKCLTLDTTFPPPLPKKERKFIIMKTIISLSPKSHLQNTKHQHALKIYIKKK